MRQVRHIVILMGTTLMGLMLPAAFAEQCQLLQVTPIEFGVYNSELLQNVGVGSMTVSCPPGTTVKIALNKGAQASGYQLKLFNHGARDYALSYILCQDSACQILWGDGTDGASILQYTFGPSTSNATIPIYAKLLPNQQGTAGQYNDNIFVTITF